MPNVACAGSDIGNSTLVNTHQRDALSSNAASSSSAGTALKYSVIRNTPKGAASPGRTRAVCVLCRPQSANMRCIGAT